MNTVFVGGAAAGAVLDIDPDARGVELSSRDVFIKPLDAVRDIQESDKVYTKDQYDIHPMTIQNLQRLPEKEPPAALLFGVGVVRPQPLSWALQELITAYCSKVEAELLESSA